MALKGLSKVVPLDFDMPLVLNLSRTKLFVSPSPSTKHVLP